jgi:hypothetical protein
VLYQENNKRVKDRRRETVLAAVSISYSVPSTKIHFEEVTCEQVVTGSLPRRITVMPGVNRGRPPDSRKGKKRIVTLSCRGWTRIGKMYWTHAETMTLIRLRLNGGEGEVGIILDGVLDRVDALNHEFKKRNMTCRVLLNKERTHCFIRRIVYK